MNIRKFITFDGKVKKLVLILMDESMENRCSHCYSKFDNDPNGELCLLFECMDNCYYLEYTLFTNSYIKSKLIINAI